MLSMSSRFSLRGVLMQLTLFLTHGTPSFRTLKTLPVWTRLDSVCWTTSVSLSKLRLSLCLSGPSPPVWMHLSGGCRTGKNKALRALSQICQCLLTRPLRFPCAGVVNEKAYLGFGFHQLFAIATFCLFAFLP